MGHRFSSQLPIILLVAGCSLTDPYVGTGPITLSPAAQTGFAHYQGLNSPSHFALAADGRAYGYSYCANSSCTGNGQTAALDSCQQRSAGVACRLYAKGRNVVWDEAAAGPTLPIAPPGDAVPDLPQSPQSAGARLMEMP